MSHLNSHRPQGLISLQTTSFDGFLASKQQETEGLMYEFEQIWLCLKLWAGLFSTLKKKTTGTRATAGGKQQQQWRCYRKKCALSKPSQRSLEQRPLVFVFSHPRDRTDQIDSSVQSLTTQTLTDGCQIPTLPQVFLLRVTCIPRTD